MRAVRRTCSCAASEILDARTAHGTDTPDQDRDQDQDFVFGDAEHENEDDDDDDDEYCLPHSGHASSSSLSHHQTASSTCSTSRYAWTQVEDDALYILRQHARDEVTGKSLTWAEIAARMPVDGCDRGDRISTASGSGEVMRRRADKACSGRWGKIKARYLGVGGGGPGDGADANSPAARLERNRALARARSSGLGGSGKGVGEKLRSKWWERGGLAVSRERVEQQRDFEPRRMTWAAWKKLNEAVDECGSAVDAVGAQAEQHDDRCESATRLFIPMLKLFWTRDGTQR